MCPAAPTSVAERYTPASLANLKAPPVFLLKSCGRRDRQRFNHALICEGLRLHDKHVMRRELVKALRHLWSESDFEAQFPRIQALWDAIDEHEAASAGANTPTEFAFDATAREQIQELINRATQGWLPLREIEADNVTYARLFPRLALSRVLVGWNSFDLRFQLEWGVFSLDRVDEIETVLGKIEDEARAAQIGGVEQTGTAFLELCAAAGTQLFSSTDAALPLIITNGPGADADAPTPPSRLHTGAKRRSAKHV